VASQYWRVKQTLLSVDDAVQECGFVFSKVCNRYSDKVTEPKWFFALFKVSVVNHFHSINRKQQHFNYKSKKANGRLETISENFFPPDAFEQRQNEHVAYGDQSLVDFWLSASDNLKNAINSQIISGSDDLSEAENFDSLAKEVQFLLGGGVNDTYIVKPLTTNTQEKTMAAKKKTAEAKSTVEKNQILADIIDAIRKDNDPKFAVQASDEVHQDYLKRIIVATGKISDEAFDNLPLASQDWFNDAAPHFKKGKPIPLPPGSEALDAAKEEEPKAAKPAKPAKAAKAAKAAKPEVEDDVDEIEEGGDVDGPEEGDDLEEEEPGEEEEPEGDAVQAKAAKPKTEKAPAEKKERKNLLKGFSVVDMRREVIRNPTVTVAQLQEIAKGKGENVKKSTITIARATTLTVIKLMKEEGRWKESIK